MSGRLDWAGLPAQGPTFDGWPVVSSDGLRVGYACPDGDGGTVAWLDRAITAEQWRAAVVAHGGNLDTASDTIARTHGGHSGYRPTGWCASERGLATPA